MFQGNAIVGQSGGPTSVINSSLCGVVQGCFELGQNHPNSKIDKVFGMKYGVEGLMQGEIIDLGDVPPEDIEGLKRTPGSALGSCRHKVQESDFPVILEQLKKNNIRYYFLAGGNDTMDTICRVEKYCKSQGYDLRVRVPDGRQRPFRDGPHARLPARRYDMSPCPLNKRAFWLAI